jgi:hypothetical protein
MVRCASIIALRTGGGGSSLVWLVGECFEQPGGCNTSTYDRYRRPQNGRLLLPTLEGEAVTINSFHKADGDKRMALENCFASVPADNEVDPTKWRQAKSKKKGDAQ